MRGHTTLGTLLEAARRSGPLALPILGAASTGATFIIWGVVPSLVMVCLLLTLYLFAVARVAAEPGPPSGDAEQPTADVAVLPPASPSAMQPPEGPGQETPEAASPSHPDDSEAFLSAISAAFDGKPDETATRMDEFIASRETETDRSQAEALKQHLLVKAGDPGALRRLRNLAESSQEARVPGLYASALAWLGQPRAAADYLISTLERVPARERDALELDATEHLLEAGDPVEADSRAERICAHDEAQVEIVARAYAIRARVYRVTSPARTMQFLESALQKDPSRSSDRFTLAYLYSEHGLYTLAIGHYTVLVENHQATAVTHNNLGVAYTRIGMPLTASRHYEKAIADGNALAAANVAQLALTAGDTARAEDLITRGTELDAREPRLISAVDRLVEGKRHEGEIQERATREFRHILDRLLEHPATGTTLPNLEGAWTVDGAATVAFTPVKYTESFSTTLADGATLILKPAASLFAASTSRAGTAYRGVAFASADRLVVILNEEGGPTTDSLTFARLPESAG